MNAQPPSSSRPQIVDALASGAAVIMRTDTIYGLIASANNQQAVNRVFELKQRPRDKSCIVLIDSYQQAYGSDGDKLRQASAHVDEEVPTSIIIDESDAPAWLRRDDGSVAYRVVRRLPLLKELLVSVGPLVAPSANPAGLEPASNIEEAQGYFGDKVSLYIDGGAVGSDVQPSRVVRVAADGRVERIR